MTLIITIGNSKGVAQSSDFRLTDATTGLTGSNEAGSKQIQAALNFNHLSIAFTGVARVGKYSTREMLEHELKRLANEDCTLQSISEALARRASSAMRPLGSRGLLAVVIAAARAERPFKVATISNIRRMNGTLTAGEFSIRIETVTKPYLSLNGCETALPREWRWKLQALLRRTEWSSEEVMRLLAAANAAAAPHSRGYVSDDCWVMACAARGTSRDCSTTRLGSAAGDILDLFEGLDLAEFVRVGLGLPPGTKVPIRHLTSGSAGKTGMVVQPAPKGTRRRTLLAGEATQVKVSTTQGSEVIFLIEQVSTELEWRCDETTRVCTLSRIVIIRSTSAANGEPEPPILTWPRFPYKLMFDGIAAQESWEHTVGFWFDGERNRLVLPQSSRDFRRLAFLEPDQEVVIAAPIGRLELAWTAGQDLPCGDIQARVSWRTRPDGTRG